MSQIESEDKQNDSDQSNEDEVVFMDDCPDWTEKLTLHNLTNWFDHYPREKVGLRDYGFNKNSKDEQCANRKFFLENKRIEQIASLYVRCRDSEGEKHGVDHNCVSCKPWLAIKNSANDSDHQNHENLQLNLNNHQNDIQPQCRSIKNKKSWICSLCSKTIPIDIKTCICIGNNNFRIDKALRKCNQAKDCLIVIKELAETLHSSIAFEIIPQEFKISSKPFEYEIYFDGELLATGEGNSKRKAQRHGAEIALDVLSSRGHSRKINLLKKFGRIGHSQIDRSLFVEICRDISDHTDLYKVIDTYEDECMLRPQIMRSVHVDEFPDIRAYKTRLFEISQLEEPSVLGCLEVCGPLRYSLAVGIFHKDVNNGRYGYNYKPPKYKKTLIKSSSKRGKRRRGKKRRKKTITTIPTPTAKDEESKKLLQVPGQSTTERPGSANSTLSNASNFSPNSISDSNGINELLIEHSEFTTTSIPDRRHSVGAIISSSNSSNRKQNMYSHPSKYEHHGIYSIDDSPLSITKQQSIRRQRRRLVLDIKDEFEDCIRIPSDNVFHCDECGEYFADNTNGRSLSEDDASSKWFCFECIQKMEETLMKPFLECHDYEHIQRKVPENKKNEEVLLSPMTPPSSEENSSVTQSNKNADSSIKDMPEMVIQQIFETEMKENFVGPLTPSSPSRQKATNQETENEQIEGSYKPKTVSTATQVNGSEDKGIQASSVKNCELKMKQMNVKNSSSSFISSSSSSSTSHFVVKDQMVLSAQSLVEDEWHNINQFKGDRYHQSGRGGYMQGPQHHHHHQSQHRHMAYGAYPHPPSWNTFHPYPHQQNIVYQHQAVQVHPHHHHHNQHHHHPNYTQPHLSHGQRSYMNPNYVCDTDFE